MQQTEGIRLSSAAYVLCHLSEETAEANSKAARADPSDGMALCGRHLPKLTLDALLLINVSFLKHGVFQEHKPTFVAMIELQ